SMNEGLSDFTNKDSKNCNGVSKRQQQLSADISKKHCQTDADCACGVDKETGQCAFGNKQFIDTSKQCPDFCTGFAGHFVLKCVNNICVMELKKMEE
ncbi:MAG: hypothetical protein ACK4SM_04795, partial [Aquificaceae bacterium]